MQHSDRIVRERERRQLTGIGMSWWAELEREGRAPRRRKLLNGYNVGWLYSEIQEWIRSQAFQEDRAA